MENLRYMVRNYDPSEAIWFGCKYRPYVENGYMSGGAGYVLSREALDRFVQNGLADNTGNSSSALSATRHFSVWLVARMTIGKYHKNIE